MVARDFENPVDADTDNAYQVRVIATDADGNGNSVSITVTVTDVLETRDAPSVRSVDISDPAMGDTFGAGEAITVQVSYNSRLTVAGAPRR